jgi:hypothetical protein
MARNMARSEKTDVCFLAQRLEEATQVSTDALAKRFGSGASFQPHSGHHPKVPL